MRATFKFSIGETGGVSRTDGQNTNQEVSMSMRAISVHEELCSEPILYQKEKETDAPSLQLGTVWTTDL